MSGLLPAMVFGLEVPAGDVMVPVVPELQASYRITMAAINPSAAPEFAGSAHGDGPVRATLKIIRQMFDDEDDDEDDLDSDEENLRALLNGADSEDDDAESVDEEEVNGGPSDPAKSEKARREAAIETLKQALAENESEDDDMSDDATDGLALGLKKGKGKALAEDEEEDSEDPDIELDDLEEFVICTLDPVSHYQQPLDITISENEQVFFKVSGTHTIYLTGNYVVPVDDRQMGMYEDEEDEYDLSPDDEELEDEEESDDLDQLEDPRLVEVDSEDEEAPKLIKHPKAAGKGRNKRSADDSDEEPAGLDEIMAKSLKPEGPTTNGDAKVSKKQSKKLKNNSGEGVSTATQPKNAKKEETPLVKNSPSNKKVQFAKNLEQGPTGSKADTKAQDGQADPKKDPKPSPIPGVRIVQGVKLDDKKMGKGNAAKDGKKISMRYIGKLVDGTVFDSNKKGKPFTFKLGQGEVIKGWDIGVQGMTIGGERRITVPPEMAYGSKSLPGIPPNSTLIFDMKVLDIR